IGMRLYTIRTTWDALAATVTECEDLDDARCIAEAWIATTAGMAMHIRIDDWRDRLLTSKEQNEARELQLKLERLLRELANPQGYFRSLTEYHDATKLVLPLLPDRFRPGSIPPP